MSQTQKDLLRRFTQLTIKDHETVPIKKRACPPAPRVHHSPVFCWSNTHYTWNVADNAKIAYKDFSYGSSKKQ